MPNLLDRLFGRDTALQVIEPQKAVVTGTGGTGPGVLAYYNDVPLWTASRNHRKLMKQAQELYHSDLIIHAAENKVSGRAAGLPWHLADENGDEITDEHGDEAQLAVRDWLEKPQGSLIGRKQMGRRELWKLTHRHDGLCGTTFWYQDQRTFGTGAPLVSLYINPARMLARQTDNGILLGWTLDSDDEGNGGVPLELEEVLQFVYDPPDMGHYGIGLVESAGMTAQVSKAVERHEASVLAGGGRLAGLVSPKPGTIVGPDEWAAAVKDWRNISSDPDSAKRLHILKGPVDFVRTAATLQELAISEVAKMSREDKLALWGVPESQLPLPSGGGLNSGETKGYDEAVLMQGAVHDRVTPFREVIQFSVLDVIAERGGPKLQLVIEEPEFDDETPLYDRAQKARDLPLTANERRAQIMLDPLPDYDLTGEPLGTAIYLPMGLSLVGAGPGEDGKLQALPEPEPPPVALLAPPETPPPPVEPAKATIQPLLGLRRKVDTRFVASTKRDVQKALSEQAKAVAKRVRARGKPDMSTGSWWDEKAENARLRRAIEPHNVLIAETVAEQVKDALGKPRKADTFEESVDEFVRQRTAERVVGINLTTRERIAALIAEGFASGLGASEVADTIETATAFDEARAELVARTESMLAYNEAALTSYGEFGVTEVEALDGDEDEVCAERNGQVFPIDDAFAIEDHPNGTLDWAPVVKAVIPDDPIVLALKALTEYAGREQPAPIVNVYPPDQPDIYVTPAPVNVYPAEVVVNMPEPKPVHKVVERDASGQITGVTETNGD